MIFVVVTADFRAEFRHTPQRVVIWYVLAMLDTIRIPTELTRPTSANPAAHPVMTTHRTGQASQPVDGV